MDKINKHREKIIEVNKLEVNKLEVNKSLWN